MKTTTDWLVIPNYVAVTIEKAKNTKHFLLTSRTFMFTQFRIISGTTATKNKFQPCMKYG